MFPASMSAQSSVHISSLTLRYARLRAAAANGYSIDRVDGAAEPQIKGHGYYWTTPSGKTIVRHPNAYRWPTLYHHSTRHISVGRDWLARIEQRTAHLPTFFRQRLIALRELVESEHSIEVISSRELAAGPWRVRRGSANRIETSYSPYGDGRDLAEFARLANQELRRQVMAACGQRVESALEPVLVQQDDFGRLCDTVAGRAVRVVCPSTGAVYWLPVTPSARTAHEAVAATFGLRAEDYQPSCQS